MPRELRPTQQYPGEHAMGLAIGGGDRDGATAQRLGFRHPGAGDLAEMRKGADQALPGVEIFGWLALAAEVLGRVEFRLDRRYHPLGDFVLEHEDVGKLAVVALGQTWVPVAASTSCAVIRRRLPALRTLPSRT